MVTKLLALIDIGQMHFDERNLDARQRVSYRYAGMGIRSSIDDDVLRTVSPGFLNAIDKIALVIALVNHQRGTMLGRQIFKSFIDIGQAKSTVDLGLACAEQVEIGAVQNQNALRHY